MSIYRVRGEKYSRLLWLQIFFAKFTIFGNGGLMLRENSVENFLKNSVEKRGWIIRKFTSPGQIGVPDRIILLPKGQIRFVELKAPGRKPRPSQYSEFRRYAKLGHYVAVIDSKERVTEYLEELDKIAIT